jgi:hypothetical protein
MKLRECPFKHKDRREPYVTSSGAEEFSIECGECGASGPVAKTPSKAISYWNRGRNPEVER